MDLDQVDLAAGVHVLSCGPLPFLRAVRTASLAGGVTVDRISYEVFGPDLWSPGSLTP